MDKETAVKAIAEIEHAFARTDLTEAERADLKEEWGCIAMSAYVTELLADEKLAKKGIAENKLPLLFAP